MAKDVLPNEIPFLSSNSIVATDYTFDASAKTVTIASAGYSRMLYIVNTTYSEVVYNPYNQDLAGTLSTSGVTLDFPTDKYMSDSDDLLVLYEGDTSGGVYPYNYDYVAVTYPTSTTEVFTYKTGGVGGTTIATMTITYTDATKCDISNIVRA